MTEAKKEISAEEAQVAIDLMDSLLDKNLDEVADLPEYAEQVPNGMYMLTIISKEKKVVSIQEKDKKEKTNAPCIQFVYEINECLELEKEEEREKVPKAGIRFNETVFFHRDVEKANSVLKAKFGDLGPSLGVERLGEIINKLEGLKVGALVKTKKDKNKEDTYYIQATNCKLL